MSKGAKASKAAKNSKRGGSLPAPASAPPPPPKNIRSPDAGICDSSAPSASFSVDHALNKLQLEPEGSRPSQGGAEAVTSHHMKPTAPRAVSSVKEPNPFRPPVPASQNPSSLPRGPPLPPQGAPAGVRRAATSSSSSSSSYSGSRAKSISSGSRHRTGESGPGRFPSSYFLKPFTPLFEHVKHYGVCPPELQEKDALFLNQVYHIYAETQIARMQRGDLSHKIGGFALDYDWDLSAQLDTLTLDFRAAGVEGLDQLTSQVEILARCPEPTQSFAFGILIALHSDVVRSNDLTTLSARAAKDPSYAIIMAQIYDYRKKFNPEFGKLAMKYYLETVNNFDSPIASMILGLKHLRGDGVRKDPDLAHRWLCHAAAANNAIAQYRLGCCQDSAVPGATSANLKSAMKWYSMAADFVPDALFMLARIHEEGREDASCKVPQNFKQSEVMYATAAALGHGMSMGGLGKMYLLGEGGVPRSYDMCRQLLTMASEVGDVDAMMVIGVMHGTQSLDYYDLALAEYWLQQSLQGGKAEAKNLLERVQSRMVSEGVSSIPSYYECEFRSPKYCKIRAEFYKSRGLARPALIEYLNAFRDDMTFGIEYLVDIMSLMRDTGISDVLVSDSMMLLANVNSDGIWVSHNVYRDCFDWRPTMLSDAELEEIYRTAPPGFLAKASSCMQKWYEILAVALAEINTRGPQAMEFFRTVFSTEHKQEIVSILLQNSLDMTPLGLKSGCLLLRLTAASYGFRNIVYSCGALAVLIKSCELCVPGVAYSREAIDNARRQRRAIVDSPTGSKSESVPPTAPIASSDSAADASTKTVAEDSVSSSTDEKAAVSSDAITSSESVSPTTAEAKENARTESASAAESDSDVSEAPATALDPMAEQMLLQSLCSLSSMIVDQKAASDFILFDGLDLLVRLSSATFECKHKFSILSIIIQIMANVMAFSSSAMWEDICEAQASHAFSYTSLVALSDIVQRVSHIKTKPATEEGAKSQDVFDVMPMTDSDFGAHVISPEAVDVGLQIGIPPTSRRSDFPPDLAFLATENSFALLSLNLIILGRVLKFCPDFFTKAVATSDMMPILHTIFRLDFLFPEMRAACAFCLCKALCANDPEAAKIIEEGLLQNSLPNIFDSSFPDGAFGAGPAGRNEVNMWSFFLFFCEGDEDDDEDDDAMPADPSENDSRGVAGTAHPSKAAAGGAGAKNTSSALGQRSVAAEPRIVRLSDVAF